MPGRDNETLSRAAAMLRAAGDEGRIQILALLLARGEMGVTEIAERTGADSSTTSHRLRILLRQSLVVRRVEGRERFYDLADRHVRSILDNVLDHADRSVSIT